MSKGTAWAENAPESFGAASHDPTPGIATGFAAKGNGICPAAIPLDILGDWVPATLAIVRLERSLRNLPEG